MKPNKPKFWITIAALYLAFLLAVVVIYNPDFKQIQNYLLFLPLYAPLIVALNIIYKDDEDNNRALWSIRYVMIGATAIVIIFKIIVESFR